MAKTLYFNTTYHASSHRGHNDAKLNGVASWWNPRTLSEARGTSGSFLAALSLAGPSAGIEFAQSAGAIPMEFLSEPLSADFTITGTITLNLWAAEGAMNDNAAVNCIIEKVDGATGVITQIARSARVTEMPITTRAVANFTVVPTSTACKKGDRLRARVFIDDAGTMGANSGANCTFGLNGASAAVDGDSYITFTENLTFTSSASPPIPYTIANTGNVSSVGVGGATRIAQQFVAKGALRSLRLRMSRSGTVPGNLIFDVYTDEAGAPGSFVGEAGRKLISTMPDGVHSSVAFNPGAGAPDVPLIPGATYWLVVRTDDVGLCSMLTGGISADTPQYKQSISGGAWTYNQGTAFGYDFNMGFSPIYFMTNVDGLGKVASPFRGSGSVNAITNTAAGPVTPIQITDSAGGTALEWYTGPLEAATLGGTAMFNVRASESNLAANASLCVQIAVVDEDGSNAVVWAKGNIESDATGGELDTTDVAKEAWIAGDDISIAAGQRLRFRIFVDDVSIAPLVSGYTVAVSHNGSVAGAVGDTYVILPNYVIEQPTGPKTLFGVTSMAISFNRTIAGSKQTFSSLSLPVAFQSTTAGKIIRTLFGSLAMPISFGAAVAGRRKALGQLALPIIFGKDLRGLRKTFGQVALPLAFTKDVRGQRKTFGQLLRSIIFGASVAGNVSTGEFTPASLPDLANWYDADSLALADGAEVASWSDKSAAGRTLTNLGGSEAPTFQTNELNGKPGVLFDGADDYLTYLAGSAFITGKEITVFAVFRQIAGVSNGRLMSFNTQESDDYGTPSWCIYDGGANDRIAPYSNGELAIQVPHPAGAVLLTTWFGADDTHNLRINKAPASTPSVSTAQMQPFTAFGTLRITLGSGWFGIPSSAGNKIFHEVVVYNRALTSTERDQVEAYLDAKWFAPGGPQTLYGATSLPVTLTRTIAGQRKTFGQVARPITFVKDIRGVRKTFGQVLAPFLFSKDVRGQRKTFGQVSLPINVSIATAGVIGAAMKYGATAMSVIFGKDVKGQRKTFGQTALPLTFSKDVAGRRRTFGQVSLPIIFTKEALGIRKVFGALSMQTLFGKETAGRRRTFSQLAFPVIFSKAVAGRKKTFGQVALPVNFLAVIAGRANKNWLGQLVMPITFSKQVVAYRKTFGKTASPYIFGAYSQGRRGRLGQLTGLPVIFVANVKTGRVGAHGQIALPIILDFATIGIKIRGAVILNEAEMIYLGEQDIVAVYVGAEQVWPS